MSGVLKSPFPSLSIPTFTPVRGQLDPDTTCTGYGSTGRSRCISCSDSSYPVHYEDPGLLLNVRTRHLRSPSISEQIQDEYRAGTVVYFCRSRGHGFIRPDNSQSNLDLNRSHNNNSAGEDLFVHISDIDSDYVPRKGDKVSFRLCPFPPKFEKFQAVNVRITSMSPQPHSRWDAPQINDDEEQMEDDRRDGIPPSGDV